MRRFFLLLLMCLLPLQSGFAGAAAYCAEEANRKAPHFGHHEHGALVAEVVPFEPPLEDLEAGHCEVCHLGATAVVHAGAQEPLFVQQPGAYQPRLSSLTPQDAPAPPHRPPIAVSA